jgi:hypothetical protein
MSEGMVEGGGGCLVDGCLSLPWYGLIGGGTNDDGDYKCRGNG